jgi:dolichyl-phosphate-mannose--protein O-mannosyl transferase
MRFRDGARAGETMRKSESFLIPVTLISLYYAFWIGLAAALISKFPVILDYLPLKGIADLAEYDTTSFEPVYSSMEETVFAPNVPIRLAIASLGAAILIVPVSWVYFITSRSKEVDQSFVQTIVILPIVVTGISMIVLNSLALAFSLAGIVAAVRFRFSLDQPSHAMYIFAAISIGLGCGIGSLGVAAVISMAFVYANLVIWKLEYGKVLSGPFFSMLTRRNRTDEDL